MNISEMENSAWEKERPPSTFENKTVNLLNGTTLNGTTLNGTTPFVNNNNCFEKSMCVKQCIMKTSDPVPPVAARKPMSKLRIIKNLFVLCIGFLLLFTAYEALANLQSTMNSNKGVGTAAQAVMYAFFNVSTFFLPTFIIKRLGCKLTLFVSILSFCPYIAANFYPHWGTLIPAAVLCGLVAGPLWSARSTYVNEISFQYATYTQDSVEVITAWFFGICCMFYQNTQIWGNLISYFVLRPGNETDFIVSNETLATCGASFCNKKMETNSTNPNLTPPTDDKRYMLIAIFLTCSVLAAVVVRLFLDPLDAEKNQENEKTSLSPRLFLATLKHLKKGNQVLLLPLTFYFGLGDGFYVSDFTKAYIACAWGVHHVGFVMICLGVVSAVMSLASGPLVKYLRRPTVFISAAVANFIMYMTLLLWKPTPDQPIVFFLISGGWGFSDAVWWSQIAALYGVLFKNDEEAAFSNFYFWNSLGFLVAYAYNTYLCTHLKIYILLGFLAAGIAGYLIVEFRMICSGKEQQNAKGNS